MSENKFIPLSVPNIKGNEIKYATEALKSEWVSTGGNMIDRFEKQLAEYVQSKGAVACQSGTAGLHLALRYYDVKTDDLVIVPTLTFIAAVNPVKYLSAEPIFIDCDDSLCMDPVKLKSFLQDECEFDGKTVKHIKSGKNVKALIVVHVFGNMADLISILAIAHEYHLPVIEDATEALGTYYTSGKYSGNYAGTIGDIGVYSFNGNKIITTGGGGMIVSNQPRILERLKYLSTQAKDDTINFIHNEIGYNYRMTNIQAAIGIAQLERLEEFISIKKSNYELYKAQFNFVNGVELLGFRDGIRSNYWFYSLFLKDDKLTKEELMEWLKEHRVQARPIWGLISDQKPYKDCLSYKLKKAHDYQANVVNLPCSTNLLEDDVLYVIDIVKKFIVKAGVIL